MQNDALKNTRDTSKWNSKKSSSTPKEGRNKKTEMKTRTNRKNKMVDMSSNI